MNNAHFEQTSFLTITKNFLPQHFWRAHGRVECDDGEDVDDEAEDARDADGLGKVSNRVLHLLDDEVQVVPTSVREQTRITGSCWKKWNLFICRLNWKVIYRISFFEQKYLKSSLRTFVLSHFGKLDLILWKNDMFMKMTRKHFWRKFN